MSKPIVVDYDALTGDCAPVRSGAAGVRLIIAAVCTLGTESAGLREGEQDVDVGRPWRSSSSRRSPPSRVGELECALCDPTTAPCGPTTNGCC
jgi:hypothetical protein